MAGYPPTEAPDKYLQENDRKAMFPDAPCLTKGKSLAPRSGLDSVSE